MNLEQKDIIIQITDDVMNMSLSSYVYTQKKDQYGFVTTNKGETEALFSALIKEYIASLDNIVAKYDESNYSKSKTNQPSRRR